jgi:hypothetical protein
MNREVQRGEVYGIVAYRFSALSCSPSTDAFLVSRELTAEPRLGISATPEKMRPMKASCADLRRCFMLVDFVVTVFCFVCFWQVGLL